MLTFVRQAGASRVHWQDFFRKDPMRKYGLIFSRFVPAMGIGVALVCACLSLLIVASTAQGKLPLTIARIGSIESLPGSSKGDMQDAQSVHAVIKLDSGSDSQASEKKPAGAQSSPDTADGEGSVDGDSSADAGAAEDKAGGTTGTEKTRADEPSLRKRVLRFFGRLHPVVVHFPIALLIVGAFFEILWVLFGKNRSRPSMIALACVVCGALGAAVAAWYGWLNADFESYGRGVAFTLRIHRWLGISTASLATIAMFSGVIAMLKARARSAVAKKPDAGTAKMGAGTAVYRVEMSVSDAATADIDPELASWIAMLDDSGKKGDNAAKGKGSLSISFARQIAPIFANHCVECHGPDEHEGELRLDAKHFVFDDRDADEQVIVPGDAQDSELYWRISLPPNDEDVMPPEDEHDPLQPLQKVLIEQWINEGAVWTNVPIIAPDEDE